MRGTDLTAVIAWLEAGCDPAEAAKELRSYQPALSSQSLSLSEAREEIGRLRDALEPFVRLANSYFYRYETRPGEWRESHENDPDDRAVYGINRVEITTGDFRRARKALENGPAVLADANTKSPAPDLSSLRKGAEVEMLLQAYDEKTELVPLGHENICLGASTYGWRKAVVKQLRELHAALVSGSREDGADA